MEVPMLSQFNPIHVIFLQDEFLILSFQIISSLEVFSPEMLPAYPTSLYMPHSSHPS
jgi:hypothetical protein